MTIKAVLPTLDGVPESVAPMYKAGDDGKFYLDIEGIDDHYAVGALRRAKDYEKEEARAAKAKLTEAQTALEQARNDLNELRKNGIPKGDVEALENSYKQKHAQKEKELGDKITQLTASLESHLIDGSAMKLATEIAAKPEYVEVLLPHVRSRLKLEQGEGDAHIVRVLDKEGKPSAGSLDDLKKELLGAKPFAALLTGSKASGGSAPGGSGNGGGASKKLSEMNEAERVEYSKNDPVGYRGALEEARKAAESKY